VQVSDGPAAPATTEVDIGTGVGAYIRLLRHRRAGWMFGASFFARLPMSMAPLGILLVVQSQRGNYSLAGLVTGAYAIGTACGTPLWGRLMDQFGQTRVLRPVSIGSAMLLAALVLTTVGGAPAAVLFVCSAAAGLTYPPIGPAMRTAWRMILPDPAERRVAFALDATAVELIFVGGPLVLSVLLAFTVPVVPLLVTAGFMVTGGLAYCHLEVRRRAITPAVADAPSIQTLAPGLRRRPVVTTTGVAALLVVMLALSVGFGQLDTSMAATAGSLLGGTSRVGLLFAATAGGSAIGGLFFGSRNWRFDERRAVPVLLSVFAVCLAAMALLLSRQHASLWVVFPLLFVTGATIAPTLIIQQSLLDHLTPASRLNEAQGFLSASNTTGAAAGTSLAGLLIDYQGLTWSFGSAAVAAGAAALIALLSQAHWRSAIQRVNDAEERRRVPLKP